jgi:hypothetical protein
MAKLRALSLVRGLTPWLDLSAQSAASKLSASRIAKRAAAVALLVLAAFSLTSAQVPDCVPGKFSDYEKLGAEGCTVGQSRFSNFRYHQASGGLPSSVISVTPGTSPGNDDPGLLFEATWVAPSQQSSISYAVEVQPKGKPISGATLEMQFADITGAGEAKVVTEICPRAATADNCAAAELKLKLEVVLNPAARKVSDTGQLNASTRQLSVIHLLSVAAGKGSAASFNGFMAVFHCKAAPAAGNIHPASQ